MQFCVQLYAGYVAMTYKSNNYRTCLQIETRACNSGQKYFRYRAITKVESTSHFITISLFPQDIAVIYQPQMTSYTHYSLYSSPL